MNNRTVKERLRWINRLSCILICAFFLVNSGCDFFQNNATQEEKLSAQFSKVVELLSKENLTKADNTLNTMKEEIKSLNQEDYNVGLWYLYKGTISFRKGLYKHALDQYSKALNIIERDGTDSYVAGEIYCQYSRVSYLMGDKKQGDIYLDKGLEFLATLKDADNDALRCRVHLLLLRAEVLESEGKLKEAESLLWRIDKLVNSLLDAKFEIAKLSSLLGMLNFEQGHLPDAEIYLTGTLKLIKKNKLDDRIDVGQVFTYLGRVNLGLGRLEKAIENFHTALRIYEPKLPAVWGDSTRLTRTCLVNAYLRKKEYSKAAACCTAVINSLKALPELSQDQKRGLEGLVELRNNILDESPDTHPKVP